MIDIEAYVFTPVAQAVRAAYDGAFVSGEYVQAPAKFPHISIVEQDNYMSVNRLDNSNTEKYATVMYQVDVYTNKTSGKKKQAREIMSLVDSMMYAKNFTRISMTPVPNYADATIYRLTARYRAETDGEALYRI